VRFLLSPDLVSKRILCPDSAAGYDVWPSKMLLWPAAITNTAAVIASPGGNTEITTTNDTDAYTPIIIVILQN